ncbi:MAG TPA: AAA family ATPase, partial [Kofleriaceae bacterium]|nr:AAA family ATPase [Kofleriaceae bacterium]
MAGAGLRFGAGADERHVGGVEARAGRVLDRRPCDELERAARLVEHGEVVGSPRHAVCAIGQLDGVLAWLGGAHPPRQAGLARAAGRQLDVLDEAVAPHDLEPARIPRAGLDDDDLIVDGAQRTGDLAFGRRDPDLIADVAGQDLGRRGGAGEEALRRDLCGRIGDVAELHRGRIERRGDPGDTGVSAGDLDVAQLGDQRAGRRCIAAVGHAAVDIAGRLRWRGPHRDLRATGRVRPGDHPSDGDHDHDQRTRADPHATSIRWHLERRRTILVYSPAVAIATYPGTVSPLRGLDSFGEAERDVWHGREAERDDIARMVTAEGFRAGLLFGEPGVGKTSLIRAGLIPHLRDHGTVALACEDLTQPAASFAAGLSAFGIQPTPNELPVMFAARAVANAVAGQQFVFVVDDVDLLCADERATAELSDLFARVVSRSAGRARFLFVCASERMNVLGALEKRTGSLFPPSNRAELARLSPQAASQILDRMLAYSGVAADPALADAVVQGISRGRPMLPADLQIAGLAMRDLKIATAAALAKIGGPSELESLWLHEACKATGNERSALRLCAELAAGGPGPRPTDQIVRRINVDLGLAEHAFNVLEARGVVGRGDPGGATWMLRHEVLTQRVKELTAPARAAARQAFDLLGSKTATKGRLSLRELRKLRNEGIAAVTPEEARVVERSKRYYMAVAAAIAAVPIALLILIWFSMHGRVYFALAPGPGGDHVVVRGGRAGLHAFFWLPGGFG